MPGHSELDHVDLNLEVSKQKLRLELAEVLYCRHLPSGDTQGLMLMTQSDFLQSAMSDLGMTRDGFAARLGCPRRTLDKWLLPETSNDHRPMPEVVWTLVREILANI